MLFVCCLYFVAILGPYSSSFALAGSSVGLREIVPWLSSEADNRGRRAARAPLEAACLPGQRTGVLRDGRRPERHARDRPPRWTCQLHHQVRLSSPLLSSSTTNGQG